MAILERDVDTKQWGNWIYVLCVQLLPSKQGWEFAHSLILLKSNERFWAIRSDRSRQMSDHEQIAQVAQSKWATVSDSLRLLRGNERMSDSLKKCWLKKSPILFLLCFIIAHFLFFWWAMLVNHLGCSPKIRVGHSVLFRSVCYVIFRSKKERSVLIHSFLEFLATYETQKNILFFSKELKRTQRTQRSFAKNRKENVSFFCKRMQERSVLFSIYI